MFLPSIVVFSISLFVTWGVYLVLGKEYALDQPDSRKQHHHPIPQIGGLVFGPFFLLLVFWLELAPVWYLITGLVTIILGLADDRYHVPWQFKLLVQLILAAYLVFLFWGRFDTIVFYNVSISISPLVLLAVFIIWFVGIYNAVNLLDGLDGLAGGFMFILLAGLAVSGTGEFFQLNGIFALVLLSFLTFNQRPAKLFMGDAGSLFLGFHIAVLPLLYAARNPDLTSLSTTPFILVTSYLVADTTRVFFTRLASDKNPMTADTIHFHHLILQQSGSYLTSIGSIYFITLISAVVAIISFQVSLSVNVMFGHLALLLLFILTPPVQTYVPIITQTIRPYYTWQKNNRTPKPYVLRTIFMVILLLGLILSVFLKYDLSALMDWQHALAVLLLLILSIMNKRNIIVMYVIQLVLILLITEITWQMELNTLFKLFTTLICVSYLIFTLEGRIGTSISKFSSLDLLLIISTLGGITLSLLGFPVSFWFSLALFALWFSLGFILRRTLFFSSP